MLKFCIVVINSSIKAIYSIEIWMRYLMYYSGVYDLKLMLKVLHLYANISAARITIGRHYNCVFINVYIQLPMYSLIISIYTWHKANKKNEGLFFHSKYTTSNSTLYCFFFWVIGNHINEN